MARRTMIRLLAVVCSLWLADCCYICISEDWGCDDHTSYPVYWSLHHHLSRPHTRDTSQSSQPIQSSPLRSLLFIRIGEEPRSQQSLFFHEDVCPPRPFNVSLPYLVLSKFNNKLPHQKLSSTEFQSFVTERWSRTWY